MKTLHNIFVPILVTFLLVCSCTKDDKISSEKASFNILKGKVDAAPLTKTLYEYSEKTLKVSWNTGDVIAVSDGNNLYKFTQTGEITDNGHTALFSGDNPTAIGEGDIVAVYPYTESLEYNLTSQEGVINKLFLTDILLAKAHVSPTVVEDLVFNPLCVVMRIPKDILITDEDFSGVMKVSLSGENVGGKLTISKTGGIDIQVDKITFPITISSGKITEDAYMTFVPKSKTGTFSYTIESERGDFYTFNVENITPTKLYAAKNIFDGNVIFEDANFKKYCVDNFDLNGDGEISFNEAKKVTSMSFLTDEEHKNISSIKGIEYFKNLKSLTCRGYDMSKRGALSTLDLSKNRALENLNCSSNKLSSIKFGDNKSLKQISCHYNELTSLDLKYYSSLESISCSYNQLTLLNVSGCTNLSYLACSNNNLSSLDLSANTNLGLLYVNDNFLSSLDITKCTSLTLLDCQNNQISLLL